jgi:hypothetical protein
MTVLDERNTEISRVGSMFFFNWRVFLKLNFCKKCKFLPKIAKNEVATETEGKILRIVSHSSS